MHPVTVIVTAKHDHISSLKRGQVLLEQSKRGEVCRASSYSLLTRLFARLILFYWITSIQTASFGASTVACSAAIIHALPRLDCM